MEGLLFGTAVGLIMVTMVWYFSDMNNRRF